MVGREFIAACVVASGLAVCWGCSESEPPSPTRGDSPSKTETAIVGRIEPAEPSIGVIALQRGLETAVTLTDGEGRYRLTGILPGEYSLLASGQGYFADTSVRNLVVGDGQTVEAMLITLRSLSASATVVGRALDAGSDKPLKDVRVTIRCNSGICANLSTVTDARGRYETSLWPGLSGTVVLQKEGYATTELAVPPQPSRATHTLSPAALAAVPHR